MKITAILGSPHGMKGTTAMLLAEVVRAAGECGAETTVLSLDELDVGPCRACEACHKTGTCPWNDDFETVKAALLAADGIVLASPNYIVSVSAQMKAVFDRCCGLLHCQQLAGRHAVAVETSGGMGGEEVQQYILRFERLLGCQTVGSVGTTGMTLADPAGRGQALVDAAALGKALVEAIDQKRTFAEQDAERAAFFDRMKALVQFRKAAWTFEYQHWQSQGWL